MAPKALHKMGKHGRFPALPCNQSIMKTGGFGQVKLFYLLLFWGGIYIEEAVSLK